MRIKKPTDGTPWALKVSRLLLLLRFLRSTLILSNHRLCRCESRNRNSKWRAAHIIQPDGMAKFHALGIAPMLSADPAFDIRARRSTLLHRHVHQLTHAAGIDRLERIAVEDFFFEVVGQEAVGIIARIPKRHLRQIIRAEGEELR